MRLRDRLHAAVQTFREAPDLRSHLTTAEYERSIAEQALEVTNRECAEMHDRIESLDSRLRFLDAKSDALSAALTEFLPKLSNTEDMKRFYGTISSTLDPSGFTLYHVAKQVTGLEVTHLFPYEDACGRFEAASGHELMGYLIACHFDAVEWVCIPGSTYERAEIGEVDTATPEYRQFERQLYERVLERMGFGDILALEGQQQTMELEQQTAPQASGMTMT